MIEGRALRFRARITKLDEKTAHVASLEDGVSGGTAGRALSLPRFTIAALVTRRWRIPGGAIVIRDFIGSMMAYAAGQMTHEEVVEL